jgi:Tetracyclin repressor-like, C-terminal domain
VLCDLLSAQAAVLEHNVSPDVAARYKRASLENVEALAALMRRHLPELGTQARQLSVHALMLTGAVWTYARPSPSVLATYEADPSLAVLRVDFAASLEEGLATLIAGTLVRAPAP